MNDADRGDFARQAMHYRNEFQQSCGILLGIAQGILADRTLVDDEIHFLESWLRAHDAASCESVGAILYRRVQSVLADGVITDAERSYLIDTLRQFVGAPERAPPEHPLVTEIAFDDVPLVTIPLHSFCMTGEFAFAPRPRCERETTDRGGLIKSGVSAKVHYVVVGSLGSPEWKHGCYGTKIDKAVQLKHSGVPLQIIREDAWAAAL